MLWAVYTLSMVTNRSDAAPVKIMNLTEQDMLAKLLAKKNLRIHHGNYKTASYDVVNSVLCLPLWEDKGKDVYDLLVGHEVGHALYSPLELVKRFYTRFPRLPFDVLNVVEDIRIERMIQAEYPGLERSFRAGYIRLLGDNFFNLNGKDLGELNFIDKLNIHGKIGKLVKVPLDQAELAIYNKCYASETFEDVLNICGDIEKYIEQNSPDKSDLLSTVPQTSSFNKAANSSGDQEVDNNQSPTSTLQNNDSDSNDSSSQNISASKNNLETNSLDNATDTASSSANTDDDDGNNKTEDSNRKHADNSGASTASLNSKHSNDPMDRLISQTDKDFQDNLKKSIDSAADKSSRVDYFIEPSKAEVMSHVVDYKEVMTSRKRRYSYSELIDCALHADQHRLVTTRSKRYVNELVTAFNMKKAAYEYSRASISKTGVLNPNRLHSYRVDDNIFKSVTTLANSKNHGMMMFVDYSSSMQTVMPSMIEHVLNVVSFCRKLNIPFEVYGFTSPPGASAQKDTAIKGELDLSALSLFQLFSGEMTKSEYELAVKEICTQTYRSKLATGRQTSASIFSKYESLSSTPLYEMLVAAHTLVKTFRAKHKVQKMNVITISDGDGSILHTRNRDYSSLILSGMLNGRQVSCQGSYYNINNRYNTYSNLVENLRITTDSNVIGFFIPRYSFKSGIYSTIKEALSSTKLPAQNIHTNANLATATLNLAELYHKTSYVSIKGAYGFTEYFILPAAASGKLDSVETEFSEVQIPVKKQKAAVAVAVAPAAPITAKQAVTKLTSMFTSFNHANLTNRALLNQFAQVIA